MVVDYVKVIWLSGVEDIVYNVSSNQTLNIVEGSTLSLDNYDDFTFNIYPNPANKYLYFNTNTSTGISYEIFDLSGRLIKNDNIFSDTPIDVSQLSSGQYIIKIQSSNKHKVLSLIKK